MPRIIRTPASDDDLWDILVYIARDNEEAAFRLVDRIDQGLSFLCEFPNAGPARLRRLFHR